MRYPEPELAVNAATRAEIVEALAAKLAALYVFPEVGARMAEHLRGRLLAGAYDDAATGDALCAALTEDIQELSHDLHLRVRYTAEPQPLISEDDLYDNPDFLAEYHQTAAAENYGYKRVERLPGNIGYIEQVGLHDATVATETAGAAFTLIANTDALILDLRANGGGDPRHVAVICSHLLERKPVHLNSFFTPETNKLEQFWTLPWVPGARYLDKPVYVLTSSRTFSGAEELSYNLKNLKRATLIGETTGGGAHPVAMHQLSAHFTASIAFARAINPITENNWEGSGVEPDIPVPAAEAYTTAYRLALQSVLEQHSTRPAALRAILEHEAREALAELEAVQPAVTT